MIVDPRRYSSDELLRDGRSIRIRAVRPDDKRRLLAHFKDLSADSRYFRFLGTKEILTDDEPARFTDLDFASRVALVATLERGDEERLSRWTVRPGGRGT